MAVAFACQPGASRGRLMAEAQPSGRSAFQRDRDRIVHSTGFRRLQYKTQVFLYHEGDHYRTRLTHSLEVAQIARSVARALDLNEDLAEAIALAHDLGHPPFGHVGEQALAAAMADYGGFDHNEQALRIVTDLERRYAAFDGLNLSWEALEGLVKHNGPITQPAGAIAAYNARHDLWLDSQPGAEAQVAALADDIAYNNHDIDDGLRAGLFTIRDLVDLPLVGPVFAELDRQYPGLEAGRLVHEAVRRLINIMILDLLAETRQRLAAARPDSADAVRRLDHPVVAFSPAMRANDRVLKDFLGERMYRHYRINRMAFKARRVIADLYAVFMANPGVLPPEWRAKAEAAAAARPRVIADYIAGMTDRYALDEHHRLFDVSMKSWTA